MDKKKRFALVIGNSGYEHMQENATATKNAEDINEKFQELGYDSTFAINKEQAELFRVLTQVVKDWEHQGEEIVIYYSGHGLCIEDRVYLAPTDVNTNIPFFEETLIEVDSIIDLFGDHRTEPSFPIIVILDCSHFDFGENCKPKLKKPNRNFGPGSNTENVAILYSIGNSQKLYVDGENSPYTKLLLEYLNEDLSIYQLDLAIRSTLKNSGRYTEGLITWMTQSLSSDYKFNRLSEPKEKMDAGQWISGEDKGKAKTSYELHRAAANGDIEAVKRLLTDLQIPVDTQDDQGDTSLHLAAENGNVEVVKLLLEYNADLNTTDNNGQTPLHRAVNKWVNSPDYMIEVIKLLKAMSVNLKARDGITFMNLFRKFIMFFGGVKEILT